MAGLLALTRNCNNIQLSRVFSLYSNTPSCFHACCSQIVIGTLVKCSHKCKRQGHSDQQLFSKIDHTIRTPDTQTLRRLLSRFLYERSKTTTSHNTKSISIRQAMNAATGKALSGAVDPSSLHVQSTTGQPLMTYPSLPSHELHETDGPHSASGYRRALILSRSRYTKYPIRTGARQPTIKVRADSLVKDDDEFAAQESSHSHKRRLRGGSHNARISATSATSPASLRDFGDGPAGLPFNEKLISRGSKSRVNVWDAICKEVRSEKAELDLMIQQSEAAPHHIVKGKSFPFKYYPFPPYPETCAAQDYVDYYILPYLLPAIQSMLDFARRSRVFQSVYSSFNPLDYLTEFLYNNNPMHHERLESPTPLFEIPFAKEWVTKYPRKPYPQWWNMGPDTAATIIQRNVRGLLIRQRHDIRKMRESWKVHEREKDKEEEIRRLLESPKVDSKKSLFSPYYHEFQGETDDTEGTEGEGDTRITPLTPAEPIVTHSDICFPCREFRHFLQGQEELRISSEEALAKQHKSSDYGSAPPGSSDNDHANFKNQHSHSDLQSSIVASG